MIDTMVQSSVMLTIGLALDHAQQHGLRVDVGSSSGRDFRDVQVAAIDRFCVVLMDDDGPDGKAHVVSREHVVSVSLRRSDLLALEAGQGVRAAGPAAE
jgi:hypothetical protein